MMSLTLRKATVAALIGTAVVLFASHPNAGAVSVGVKCNSYQFNAGGSPPTIYKATIYERHTRCRKADTIIRDFQHMGADVVVHNRGGPLNATYWTLKKYPGWHCNIGAGGGASVHWNQLAQYVLTSEGVRHEANRTANRERPTYAN